MADSGTNINLGTTLTPCADKPKVNGLQTTLPDGTTMTATHKALFSLPQQSKEARMAHIFLNLHTGTLPSLHPSLSLGAICDDEGMTPLTQMNMTNINNDKIIAQGSHNHHNGMWNVPFDQDQVWFKPSTTPQDNESSKTIALNTTHKPILTIKHLAHALLTAKHCICNAFANQTKFKPTQCHCVATGFPVKSTWTWAIKHESHKTWPRSTAKLISRHLNDSIITALGHKIQKCQGAQSMEEKPKSPKTTGENTPSKTDIDNQPCPHKIVNITDAAVPNPTNQLGQTIHMGLAGKFSILPHGHLKCAFVLCGCDTNVIIPVAMKNGRVM